MKFGFHISNRNVMYKNKYQYKNVANKCKNETQAQ